jgi:hypothetical protein
VLATVAANVMYGQSFGVAGEVISAWPALAFLLASEILLSMRARPVADQVKVETTDQVGLETVTAQVLPMPTGDKAPRMPTRTRATRTTPKRKPSPEKLFAADIEAGKVPSIRAIKERARVGTDNARVIHEQLLELIDVSQAA